MSGHHLALIYTMVLTSAADNDMSDAELQTIGDTVTHLPVFKDFNRGELTAIARECGDLLTDEEGLDKALDVIKAGLPARLRPTAYLLACDVAAADGKIEQEEIRMLELIRHSLDIDRLTAAAIERAAAARFAKPE